LLFGRNTIPLLGHNRDYAYGLTMFENDDIDFYREEIVLGMGINIKLLQVLVTIQLERKLSK
jgi:penicillin amidase